MKRARLFGTDGIRGLANRFPMTAEVALQVGAATARVLEGEALAVFQATRQGLAVQVAHLQPMQEVAAAE